MGSDGPAGRKRSRLNQPVSDETVAKYTAARAFLYAEWLGASMIVASFTLLYFLTAATQASGPVILGVSIGFGALGTLVFWSARTAYRRIDFPWAQKWETMANLLAASGAIFWLLFALLEVLTSLRIPVGAP